MRQIKVKFDDSLSAYRGRKYWLCEETGRYYTQIDGEWLTCTDNYWLEPDCHVADDVEIVVEPTVKEYHGGEEVFSKRHGKNIHIMMAHRSQQPNGECKVDYYTMVDCTKVMPDEVEDKH